MVLRNVFDHAIDKWWLERKQNHVLNLLSKKPKIPTVMHPTLSWDQLPKVFEALERNEANESVVMLAALNVVFMTFLSVGSMAPMKWDELDGKEIFVKYLLTSSPDYCLIWEGFILYGYWVVVLNLCLPL